MQLVAGYVSDSVRKVLKRFDKNAVSGLLKHLCHFEIEGDFILSLNSENNPFVSVINNIITRGVPTIPNLLIENLLSETFKKSQLEESSKLGMINYMPKYSKKEKQEIFEALHIIDPRVNLTEDNYRTENLESEFEKSFLFEYLRERDTEHLIQLLETQRKIDTIIHPDRANQFARQRVDFSIEFPYQIIDQYTSYGEEREKKYYYGLVVEIDGIHHQELTQSILDNNRNNEIEEVEWNIYRISSLTDNSFVKWFNNIPYFKIVKKNYKKPITQEWSTILQTTLTPFAIARIQKTIIELINTGILNIEDEQWNVLVYEKDVPCANLALQDLSEMFNNLFQLAEVKKEFPKVELDIISTPEFIDSPLHQNTNVKTIDTFKQIKRYDLFIDISVLTRANIENDKYDLNAKTKVKIRSSHYINTKRKIKTAGLIKYRQITKKDDNEKYTSIKEAESILTYFLRNIFRKESFRIGQLPILNRALQHKSVIGLLPTGGGKSLTYQLASILQPGVTIVIDPIKSLMQDQYDSLIKNGIDICNFINSKLDTTERKEATNKLVEGEVMFSFVSPERLQIKEFRDNLNEMPKNNVYFSYCVIDEVHCVSEWGHDFRTSYLSLGKNAIEHCKVKNLSHIPIFGLTATASFDVLSDVERELSGDGITNIDAETIVRFENSNRDELQYQIINVDAEFEINEEFSLELPNGEIVDDIPKPIKEDIKVKIAVTKQERLNELIKEIPYQIEKYNNQSKELVESAQKREFEKTDNKRNCIKIENYNPEFFFDDKNTNAGIVFCPHRTWYQGVTDRFKFDKYDKDVKNDEGEIIHKRGDFILDENGGKVKLPPSKRKGVADSIEQNFKDFKVSFFMGSSDEDENIGKEIEKESFKNQEKFINNQQNIMIATKAFGMGIDKPNVRYTIHFNIPSSIESFVQEAGRAGRDRNIALSSILFNQQTIFYFNNRFYKDIKQEIEPEIYQKLKPLKNLKFYRNDISELFQKIQIPKTTNFEKYIGKIQVDKDNLLFFHNNSFKGQDKEKVIIYELLNRITYPQKNNKYSLEEDIKELFEINILNLNFVENTNLLWVNGEFGQNSNYGNIRIDTWNYFFFNTHPRELSQEIFNFIKNRISQDCNITNVEEVSNWLLANQQIPQEKGIEERLKEINIGQEINPEIVIEFSNETTNRTEYINQLKNELDKKYQRNNLTEDKINKSIAQHFEEFIENLQKEDHSINLLDNIDRLKKLKLLFYSPRKKADTDKAIFRLMSIGVIDDYTVDYNTKTYTLKIVKKEEGKYTKNLQNYIRRYYSDIRAENKIQIVKDYKGESEIQKCLGYLTDFIYSEIEKKRSRSIDDIILACKIGLQKNGNEELKDFIFLYFNSKYAREDYNINGKPYSLLNDTENGKIFSFEIVWKYIKAIEIDDSGAQKDNVKHLRGACLRLLRSNPENGALLLLKSFSLFVIGFEDNESLEQETKESFFEGFNQMKKQDSKLAFDKFMARVQHFRKKTLENAHKKEEVGLIIDKYIDELYFRFHNDWLTNFTNKYLKGYDR